MQWESAPMIWIYLNLMSLMVIGLIHIFRLALELDYDIIGSSIDLKKGFDYGGFLLNRLLALVLKFLKYLL
jgi:hypothetical protein